MTNPGQPIQHSNSQAKQQNLNGFFFSFTSKYHKNSSS